MKQAFRALKAEWNDYTEGERLIRDVTSNDDNPPTVGQLKRICYLLEQPENYQRMYMMLMRRVTDVRYLRHMEKGLIVAEYILKNGEHRFVRSCKVHIAHFKKLRGYKYELYGRDYGGNVRRRAKRITEYLSNDAKLENARAKAQGPGYKKRVKAAPSSANKSAKKGSGKRSSKSTGKSSKVSAAGDTNIKPSSGKRKRKSGSNKGAKTGAPKQAPQEVATGQQAPAQQQAAAVVPKEQLAPEEDLLGGDLFAESAPEPATQLTDEQWLFSLAIEAPQSGQGDDGGVYGFAEVPEEDLFGDADDPFDEFDDGVVDDGAAADENKEDNSGEEWLTQLTNLDNPLQVVEKPRQTKQKGKTMAELAQQDQSTIPTQFDPSFVSSIQQDISGQVPTQSQGLVQGQVQSQSQPQQSQAQPRNNGQYSGGYFDKPADPFASFFQAPSQQAPQSQAAPQQGSIFMQQPMSQAPQQRSPQQRTVNDPFAAMHNQPVSSAGAYNNPAFGQPVQRDPFAGLGNLQ